MSSKVMKRIALAALMILMVCVMGCAMAETVETVSYVMPSAFGQTYAQEFFPKELGEQIDQDYINQTVTLEELNAKYSCAYEIDSEHAGYFAIQDDKTKLQFEVDAAGYLVMPVLRFKTANSTYADAATITTTLTDNTTSEVYTVKNTVKMAKRGNPVDDEMNVAPFIVQEGELLTLHCEYKDINGEAQNFTYEWSIPLGMVDGKPKVDVLPSNGTTCTFPIKPEYNGKRVTIAVHYNGKLVDNVAAQLTVLPTLSVTEEVKPAAVDGVITVTEGEQVQISVIPECSDSSIVMSYAWELGGTALENATGSYTFVPKLEQNGQIISVEVIASADVIPQTATKFSYQLNVKEKPKPTLSVTASTLPAAVDGVITVTEGEQVQIELSPSCSESGLGLSYEWKLDDERIDIAEGASGYAFVPALEQSGKTISVTVIPAKNVEAQTATTFTYTLNVQPKPIEPPIWYEFMVMYADGKYELTKLDDDRALLQVEKGKRVTICANYEYTGTGSQELFWNFNNGSGWQALESKTDTCTFTFAEAGNLSFTVNDNGVVLDKSIIVEELEIVPTLSMTVETTPAAVNGVITVTEGDTVTITAKPVCSDPSVKIGFWWGMETIGDESSYEDIDCAEASYTFKATAAEYNGKHISVAATVPQDQEVENVGETAYGFDLVVNAKAPVVETITWPILLNGAGSNSSRISLDDNEYLSEHFLSKYAPNKLTMQATAGKGITIVDSSVSRIKFEATEQANGEFLTVTVTNPDGETYIGKYQFVIDTIYKGVTVKADSDVTLTENGTAFYELVVKEGTTLTVTTNYSLLNGQKADMSYEWALARKSLNNTSNSYTFTVTKEHAGEALTIFAQSKTNPQCLNQDIIEIVVESDETITKVEYEEGIPDHAISETAKEEIAETLIQNSTITKEEIEEKGIAVVIEEKMEETILEKAAEAFKNEVTEEPVEIPEEQTAVYEVTLMYTEDGGKTWEKADKEHWPESGKLDVVLPYPEGTNQETTKFVVAHMFTQTTADHKAGEVEYPVVTNMADGIHFQVSGLSPIALAWTYEPMYIVFHSEYGSELPVEAVTEDLKKAGLTSPALIKAKLETEMAAKALSMGKTLDTKQLTLTDITLAYSDDGMNSWTEITIDEWIDDTVFVFLPYPEGTNANTHDFLIAHMFAKGPKAGQIEYLDYQVEADGLTVEVTSMSPFAIAAFEKSAPAVVPATGDSATPYLWLLGMIIAAAGCTIILGKRRQNG